VVVDWHEQFKLLKLRFPVMFILCASTGEIAYGHIQHAAFGDEAPCQSWIDSLGMARGQAAKPMVHACLTNAKYSFDVTAITMAEIRCIALPCSTVHAIVDMPS